MDPSERVCFYVCALVFVCAKRVCVCVSGAVSASEQQDGTTHQFLKVSVSLVHRVVTAAAR